MHHESLSRSDMFMCSLPLYLLQTTVLWADMMCGGCSKAITGMLKRVPGTCRGALIPLSRRSASCPISLLSSIK